MAGICANSSQAKGRVKRANLTLQERLVKEMCLENITCIDAANAWIETFISDFQPPLCQTGKIPEKPSPHGLESHLELDDIFAWQTLRTLSKALTFQYEKILYLVDPTDENSRIVGEEILAFDYTDGTLKFRHGNRTLKYQMFDKLDCISQGRIVDNKRLDAVLKLAKEKQDELEAAGKRKAQPEYA